LVQTVKYVIGILDFLVFYGLCYHFVKVAFIDGFVVTVEYVF